MLNERQIYIHIYHVDPRAIACASACASTYVEAKVDTTETPYMAYRVPKEETIIRWKSRTTNEIPGTHSKKEREEDTTRV